MSTREEQRARARAEREAKEQAQAGRQRRARRLWQLGGVVALAALVAGVLIVVSQSDSGGGETPAGSEGASGAAGAQAVQQGLDGIPQRGRYLGAADAPVVMTEFVDLQCPFCRDFSVEVLPDLVSRYVRDGRLRIEQRLLTFIGEDSVKAARAALVAGRENRQWTFTELFFTNQGEENGGYVTDDFLRQVATGAGVEPSAAVVDDAEDPVVTQRLEQDEAAGSAAGISGTPSFTIGRRGAVQQPLEVSALTTEAFTAPIDRLVRQAR